jgi:ketosteroid isomerase-like protein
MNAKFAEADRNENLVRRLYTLADAAAKDTSRYVSHFADGGYFYDASDGRKYYGADIGTVVRSYSLAVPDLRRSIHSFYFDHNIVVTELSLIGTHRADLVIGARTIPATGRQINVTCCDIFNIKRGKVTSLHCYLTSSSIPDQIRTT